LFEQTQSEPCTGDPILLAVKLLQGHYERNFLLSETIISVKMKFTYVMGTSFMELTLCFHRFFFIVSTLFSPLHEMQYAGCAKLLAAASEL
jgi:hypothetical protein